MAQFMPLFPKRGNVNAAQWCVVLTTRNRAAMLKRALESCARQTVRCDVVVIDEASTDATPEIVQQFPGTIYIRNAEPRGHSAAANQGILAAQAEWIKPLDDDDWLAPKCIEVMTDALTKAHAHGINPVLISAGSIEVDSNETELRRTRQLATQTACIKSHDLLTLMMLDQAPIGTPVQVGHRRDAALKVGGWNEHREFSHQHGDEVELWIKLAAQGDGVFLPDCVAYRTIWPGGSQLSIPPDERCRSNVYLKQQIAAQLGEPLPRGIEQYLALHWAIVAAKERNYAQAVRLGLRWMSNPMSMKYLLRRRNFEDAKNLLVAV